MAKSCGDKIQDLELEGGGWRIEEVKSLELFMALPLDL